jgi:hypothetical protein
MKIDKRKIEAAEPFYFNFILNALTGHNPDWYFRDHEAAIRYYARALQLSSKLQPCKVYRGVLTVATPNGLITPHDHCTFLSFSEDRKIAECFADIDHPMSIFVRRQHPSFTGFLIEHVAQPEEVIFHWKWAEPLVLHQYLENGIDVILEQKEVMLFQSGKTFKGIEFPRGGSLKNGYDPGFI